VDLLANVGLGFSVALTPINLVFCFLGTLVGTLLGVLPGLGPAGAVAFLLSLTFKMEPASAVIMLAEIYYGAMYSGSTTSILVNIPGETASVVTCLDGYRMARQGRAGEALGIAAFGSFIAGTVGVIGLMFLAQLLGRAALRFGPPEFFALTLTGLTLVAYLTQGSMIKALIMATRTVGMDPIFRPGALHLPNSGTERRLRSRAGGYGAFRHRGGAQKSGTHRVTMSVRSQDQRPTAQCQRLEGQRLADRARLAFRFSPRHLAGPGACHRIICLLRYGKTIVPVSGKVRYRCHRRCRRSGGGK